jgi:tetratricopeptide (TPR) repeat protein
MTAGDDPSSTSAAQPGSSGAHGGASGPPPSPDPEAASRTADKVATGPAEPLGDKPIPLPPLSPEARPSAAPAPARTGPGVLEGVLVGAVLTLGFVLASFPARNSDVWLHLAAGRALAQGEHPLGVEPFTHTAAGATWVNPSWLFDLLAYYVHEGLGGGWLVALKALVAALVAGVLVSVGRRGPSLWGAVACAALAVLALGPVLQLQPQALSCLLLALTLWVLDRPHRLAWGEGGGSGKVALTAHWPLVPLFALWANLDGWFVLGPAVVALYLLGQLLQARGKQGGEAVLPGELRALGVALAAGLLACLANPHHVRALALPASLGLTDAAQILRDDPLFQRPGRSPFGAAYFQSGAGLTAAGLAYFLLAGLGLVSFAVNRAGLRWWRGLVFGALLLLSAYDARNIPFFAVVAAPVLALNFQEAAARARRAGPGRADSWAVAGPVLTLLSVVTLTVAAWPGWLQPGPYEPRRWAVEPDPSLPRLADHLRRLRREGRLQPGDLCLNSSPALADQLAWFCPEAKGFLDGRLNVPVEVAEDYVALVHALLRVPLDTGRLGEARARRAADWKRILRERKVNHVILLDTDPRKTSLALGHLLSRPGEWALLDVAGTAAVFGWRDPEQPAAAERFARLRLDRSRLALDPPPEHKAPRTWPGREPEPYTFWDAFWRPRPRRSADLNEAALFLLMWDADHARAVAEQQAAWKRRIPFTGLTGLLAVDESPITRALRLGGADFVVGLAQLRYQAEQDQGPPELLLLALRAARRALHQDPDNASAHLALAEAYKRWELHTRERAFRGPGSMLDRLRTVQTVTALAQAARLQPDLARAHLGLVSLYERLKFKDLALDHLSKFRDLVRRAGRAPGEDADRFETQLALLEERLDRLRQEVQEGEKLYAANSANLKVYYRALLAQRHGLTGKALELLLASDVAAFGKPGMVLELGLLLETGRVKEVRQWVPSEAGGAGETKEVREAREALGEGPYRRLQALLLAATGDYQLADEQLERLAEAELPGGGLRAGKSPSFPMDFSTKWANTLLTGGGMGVGGGLPTLAPLGVALKRSLGEIPPGFQGLRHQAEMSTLRGLLDLESGQTAAAARRFREAVALWEGEKGLGNGLDFPLRRLAQQMLGKLRGAGVAP